MRESSTNKTSTPPTTRLLRSEDGLLHPLSSAPANIEAELARMGYELLPIGDTQWVSSYRRAGSNEYAVVIRMEKVHYLVLIPSLQAYRGFMREYASAPAVFDQLIPQ